MAVAVSATGTTLVGASSVASITYTGITVKSGDTDLIVTLCLGATATTSGWIAHWDSGGTNQAMTVIGSLVTNASGISSMVVLGLRNPTAGNKTLSLSWTGAQYPVIDAISFTGGDTSSDANAFKNATTGSTSSLAVTSASGAYAFAAIAAAGSLTSLNQTSLYVDTTSNGSDSAASYAAGASTVTFAASGATGAIAMVGFSIAAASGSVSALAAAAAVKLMAKPLIAGRAPIHGSGLAALASHATPSPRASLLASIMTQGKAGATFSGRTALAAITRIAEQTKALVSTAAPPPQVRWVTATTYGSQVNIVLTPTSTPPNNDILLAVLFAGNAGGTAANTTISPPSGWTQLGSDLIVLDGGSFNGRGAVYWKRAASETGGTYTFIVNSGTATQCQGLLYSISGALASGSPFDASSQDAGSTVATATTAAGTEALTSTALSVTTTTSKDLLIQAAVSWSGAGSLTPPTGFSTEINSGVLFSSQQQFASTGATGNEVMTVNTAVNPWYGWLIAVLPASGAGSISNVALAAMTLLANRATAAIVGVAQFTTLHGAIGSSFKAKAAVSAATSLFGITPATLRGTSQFTGQVILEVQTLVYPKMRGAVGFGAQALAAAVRIATKVRSGISGITALSSQTTLASRSQTTPSFVALLASTASAASKAAARSTAHVLLSAVSRVASMTRPGISGVTSLAATVVSAFNGNTLAVFNAVLATRTVSSFKSGTTTVGRVLLSAFTKVATRAQLVRPGMIVLFAVSLVKLGAAALPRGVLSLHGATSMQIVSRPWGVATAWITGRAEMVTASKAGVLAVTALMGRAVSGSFGHAAMAARTGLAGITRLTALTSSALRATVLLAAMIDIRTQGRGGMLAVAPMIVMLGKTMIRSSALALLRMFRPSPRKVTPSSRNATVSASSPSRTVIAPSPAQES